MSFERARLQACRTAARETGFGPEGLPQGQNAACFGELTRC